MELHACLAFLAVDRHARRRWACPHSIFTPTAELATTWLTSRLTRETCGNQHAVRDGASVFVEEGQRGRCRVIVGILKKYPGVKGRLVLPSAKYQMCAAISPRRYRFLLHRST